MLSGKRLAACQRCYQEEDAGLQSRRLRSLENNRAHRGALGFTNWVNSLKNEGGVATSLPSHVEVRLGSQCNLRCRICAPEFSHLIRKEMESLAQEGTILPEFYIQNLHEAQKRDDKSWQEDYVQKVLANADNINSLYFAAGEPLITPAYQKLVQGLVENQHAKHIHLTINTNGTTASPFWLESLAHFQKVELYLSLDSIGSALEYQRTGSSWKKIQDNIQKFFSLGDRVHLKIFPTLSIYNIRTLGPMLSWFGDCYEQYGSGSLSLSLNFLHTPKFLKATMLPAQFVPELREQWQAIASSCPYFNTQEGKDNLKRLENTLDRCGHSTHPSQIQTLLHYTQIMDNRYHQSLEKELPEAGQIFEVFRSQI